MGMATLAQGIINVLFVVFAREVLHVDALTFGVLNAVWGIGGIVGVLLIGPVGRIVSPARLVAIGELTVGVIFLTMFTAPALLLTLALSALMGLPATGYSVSTQLLLQRRVADHYRGRVFGALGTTFAMALLGGMGLASVVGEWFGAAPVLTSAGGLFFLAGVVALVLLPGAGKTHSVALDTPTDQGIKG